MITRSFNHLSTSMSQVQWQERLITLQRVVLLRLQLLIRTDGGRHYDHAQSHCRPCECPSCV